MNNIIYDYKFINTAGTTQVYTDAVTLGRVILPATLVGTVDIYDATSGTSPTIIHFPIGSAANTYFFDVTCGKGIRVVTSSSSDNVVITYKQR